MNTQACCSHSKITRITEDHPGGFKSEYWKCETCETHFSPEPLMQGRILRDWFAGQAMAGIMACPNINATAIKIAEESYLQADKMLAQRNKK